MTEGPAGRHEKSMCVRVWLEVGHACEPRSSALGRALALDWRVWVRGVGGRDISAFVHKVVFILNPASAFVYPKRVIQEPPYEIQESGCASIDIPINVYLKYSNKPKRIRLRYSLHIENTSKSSSESRCVYYDVENPSEELWRALMQGGGEVVARVGARARPDRLLVLLSHAEDQPRLFPANRYKFVEPLETPRKHGPKRQKQIIVEEICPKCGDPTNVDFRKHLRAVSMTEDEINRVSKLYLSFTGYEKTAGALELPPLSDPIYRVPELPQPLRGALTTVEGDYAMQ